jgi:hypothetical protein
MRFDHQPPPPRLHRSRGVTYVAGRWVAPSGQVVDPLEVAILERFRDTGIIDRTTNAPRFALWKPSRALNLLQLSDASWLARAGGNAALVSGARGRARVWSRMIYAAYRDIDGLIWASSVLSAGRSIVLYERAADSCPAAPASDRALSEPFLQPALGRIAGAYGLTLV